MGGSSWSTSSYTDRTTAKVAAGKPMFAYDHDIRTRAVSAKIHADLDPKGVNRESRDSPTHPISEPIAVFFDETGSMGDVPVMIQKKLPQLMGMLLRKNFSEHPAVFVGAIGDAPNDRAPLQVGQFESGAEIDDSLTKFWLERLGGGTSEESYELAMYFASRHFVTDHWEKRGEKGILFFIGDEKPYPAVNKSQVLQHIGDTIQDNIPTEDMLAELREKWDVFFIMPKLTNHWGDKSVEDRWKGLLGQNFLKLEDPETICEFIAAQVGVWSGRSSIDAAEHELIDAGVSPSKAKSVSKDLVPFESKGLPSKVTSSGAGSGLAKF